jgi:hypothetical protein
MGIIINFVKLYCFNTSNIVSIGIIPNTFRIFDDHLT